MCRRGLSLVQKPFLNVFKHAERRLDRSQSRSRMCSGLYPPSRQDTWDSLCQRTYHLSGLHPATLTPAVPDNQTSEITSSPSVPVAAARREATVMGDRGGPARHDKGARAKTTDGTSRSVRCSGVAAPVDGRQCRSTAHAKDTANCCVGTAGQCRRDNEVQASSGKEAAALATNASAWQARCLTWLLVFVITTSLCRASGQSEAKVKTSHCSYTLVVNEFDASKCPAMHPDVMARDSSFDQGYAQHPFKMDYPPGGRVMHDKHDNVNTNGNGNVDVLAMHVRELDKRLAEETVRTHELNSTLARQASTLAAAEKQLSTYAANFTAVYRSMMFVHRQLKRQRKINKSLSKKVSNILLDVVEVNNVLTRAPTSSHDGVITTASKNFQVQSVPKVSSCPGITNKSTTYKDCAEVFEGGHKFSGVYYVKPSTAACPIPVWCDMDTPPGGWLVFQRRQDGSVSFKHDWQGYRDGFGNVAGEHWLGNDNIFLISNQDYYKLRVDLWDFTGNRVHAMYTTFQVAGERDKYRLTINGYSGSAQDSLYQHNRMQFSTPDSDNDGRRDASCATEWEAGWWFNNCWYALLNGPYYNRSDVSFRGIAWNNWKREQLRRTEMKMRPSETRDSPAN